MKLSGFRLPAYHERTANVRALRDRNILVYFPHGLGDWAQFCYISHLLEPSNRYWITRHGDDFVALVDGCTRLRPAYIGINSTVNDFGAAFGNRDFGLDYNSLDGSAQDLSLPEPILDLCIREHVDAFLWIVFPETYGNEQFPFHTKARSAARSLLMEDRLQSLDFQKPFASTLTFEVPRFIRTWVEARLQSLLGLRGRRLCLIARHGYTSTQKNWGHDFRADLPPSDRREAQECRTFMRLLKEKDERWIFLSMEERIFEGDDSIRSPELGAFTYADLFGTIDAAALPFALVLKVLASLAELCVGVPTGPFHVCMAKPDLAVVGIWIHHLPSWYEEPRSGVINLVGNHVRRKINHQPGSFNARGGLNFALTLTGSRVIHGHQVFLAVEKLLY